MASKYTRNRLRGGLRLALSAGTGIVVAASLAGPAYARDGAIPVRRTVQSTGGTTASSAQQAATKKDDEQSSTMQSTKEKQTTTLQTVVVTGTRALFNRTAVQSLAPIDVLTSQAIQSTGAPNLMTALRTLLPSINFAQPANVDVSAAVRPIQLRGLSPSEVLVLINGKRAHTTSTLGVDGETFATGSSGVDLNSIPMNAIKRIEVLRDGAAAQYGSDAIAGVINIILKGGSRHGEAGVSFGQYAAGDGATWRADVGRGFNLGQKGWAYVTLNYQHQQPTNRAGRDFRFPNDPTYGTVTFKDGLNKNAKRQVGINFQYDLTRSAQLYGYYLYSKRNSVGHGYFRSLSTYKEAHPAVAIVYPNGFLPTEHSTLEDSYAVFGIRGTTIGGWHYDVSGNTGANHWKFHTSDTYNYSLAPTLGVDAPTHFYIGTTALRDNVLSANFVNSYEVSWLPNALSVAWGLAYRDEIYKLKEGEPLSYFGQGGQVFPGFQPSDAGVHTRQNKAVYVDVETDLTNKLTGEAAVRYEHYSDFGKTIPWKLSGRYQFTDSFAMRGTISTGFRAPSLQQSWYSSTSLNSFVNQTTGKQFLATEHTFPVDRPAAIALGAQSLTAETSRNYAMGLVYSPSNGLIVTLDGYQIAVHDRVVLSGFLTGPEVQNFLTSVGIPFVAGGAFFTNAIDTRTRGVSLVASRPFHFGSGNIIKLTVGANYNKTVVTSVKPNPPQLGLHGLILPVFSEGRRENATTNTPHSKTFVAALWQRGRLTINGRLIRFGSFGYSGTLTTSPQTFHPSYVLDASATYQWRKRWFFTAGSTDLNNAYPEKNNASNDFDGMFVYPHRSPIGDGGAYYYVKASYRW